VEEEQEAHQRGRCLADSLIRREPDASDTDRTGEVGADGRGAAAGWFINCSTSACRSTRSGGTMVAWPSTWCPVYSKGERVVIGHANGVITIDLVESLDA